MDRLRETQMIDYAQALNGAQLAAVTAGDGPVLVVAGAGSGKTRTIVYRLAWLAEHGVSPESILLLTFTRKAAREMLQRAGALLGQGLSGVQGGTFHAFAFSVLRRWRPAWLGERPFTLMDSADITAAVRQCKADLNLGKGDRSFPKSASVVAFLSKARNKELPLAEVLRREAFHLEPYVEPLERLGAAYDAYRRENGLLDYDDLLFELEALLRDNAVAADALRARFRHILVDEYQDTNLVQARIVRLLAGPLPDASAAEAPPPLCNVMAVGDEAQSIYAFGAPMSAISWTFRNCSPARASCRWRRITAPRGQCSTWPTACWNTRRNPSTSICSRAGRAGSPCAS